MRVAFVRGAYLNNYEAQNYIFKRDRIAITAFSSLRPIHTNVPFPRIGLPSLSDIYFPRFIANRTIGDSQILFGLEHSLAQFDIIHAADPHYYYTYQCAKMRAQNAINKLVLTSWETIPFNNESVWAKKRIKKYSLSQADAFLCYSKRSADCLRKEGVSADRIHTISLGIDLMRFKPVRKKITKQVSIVFVGRLVPEKGVMDLLTVFAQLPRNSASLTIIGGGPLEGRIHAYIAEHNLTNTVTLRQSSYDTIQTEYQNADIAVFPSFTTPTWEEQYGMALVESMASGLAIVAYKSGSIPQIVDRAALLVPESDLIHLLQALKSLIQNPQLRHKLGTMSRRRAETHFDARQTAQKINRLYTSL